MKWLVLFVIVVGAGYFAWGAYNSRYGAREARSCQHIAKLCGEHFGPDGTLRCERGLAEMREISGDATADRAQTCVAESTECATAMGCLAGAGIGTAVDVGKGFFEGVWKSLGQ